MAQQQWQIDEAKILDIGNENETVGKLRLSLVAGRVDIVTHDDSPTARLEVHEVKGQPLVVGWDGWTLNISQVKDKSGNLWDSVKALGDMSKRSARISLSVPATTDITSSTASAETLINGARASVRINTVTGSLTLDDIVGNVDAKTVNGNIECHALEGDFSGNSVSGALTVQASKLRQVRLNTISGDINLDLTDGSAQIQSNSISGDVTVRVPKGGGYDVSAHSLSGSVVIDGQSMNGDGDSAHQGGGRLSDGDKALVIKANSVSGNIIVLRSADTQDTPTRDTQSTPPRDIQDTPPRDTPRDGDEG